MIRKKFIGCSGSPRTLATQPGSTGHQASIDTAASNFISSRGRRPDWSGFIRRMWLATEWYCWN